ncbi:MAG: hypothetical protein QOH47_795 [Sphingomonadales bacterium]|jgi:hypothetical protein|nr:hypothetical protein [Sphingomonadales bacterium]
MISMSAGAIALKLLRRFWYVIPLIGLTIALMITRSTLERRTEERDNLQAFKTLVVTTTREAADNPRLAAEHVPAQIAALGRSVVALRDGLNRCNASARAAAENDARRQIAAQEALRAAQARAQATQGLVGRLRSSAAAERPAGAACEPSETVREIWR